MADPHGPDSTVHRAALAILVLGAARHYGYKLFTESAWAWNILGAVVMAVLVVWVVWRLKSRLAAFVGLWWIAEEAMVAGCGALWVLDPWTIRQGQDVCYPLLDFDLGKIGVLMLAILLFRVGHK